MPFMEGVSEERATSLMADLGGLILNMLLFDALHALPCPRRCLDDYYGPSICHKGFGTSEKHALACICKLVGWCMCTVCDECALVGLLVQ